MALTRKLLKSLGLEETAVDTIIDAHTETVDALKKERDQYKADAEKLPTVAKERDDALEKLGKAPDAAKVQADFDAYKEKVEHERQASQKRAAYDALLKKAGMERESARKLVLGAADLNSLTLDKSGNLEGADDLEAKIKTEYADFIGSSHTTGTPTTTPPTGGAKTPMTRAEILEIKDTSARQKAIAENLELFQK